MIQERKPYPVRKGTLRDLGFQQWFVMRRGIDAYHNFVSTLSLSPTEQAFIFKTTGSTIHEWRREYYKEQSKMAA